MHPTMHFTVSFLEPGLHVYHVTLTMDNLAPGTHTLTLPVWTPGSYEVRDFAGQLFDMHVDQSGPLEVHHTKKNQWLFETVNNGPVVARYQVYAYQLGVSSSHLDQSHAFFNGAQLFVLLDDQKDIPITVELQSPPGWDTATGLDRSPERPGVYLARNYDVLIDSPVETGPHRSLTFMVDDKLHTVALWGQGNEDPEQLVQDIEKIVRSQSQMFGGMPYDHYTFILQISDRGTGGLEHLNSTVCGIPRFAFRPHKSYIKVLRLISHEFFHLWNVKRIHPEMLGPFDYNREVHTHLLWAMEGFTDYYGHLTLRRSGLQSEKEYLKDLAERIKLYETLPGRFVQSLSESSFDTWIKFYRRTPDSPNRTISYYLKGDLVGTCLDLEIRHRTHNRYSLDTVLQRLYERYGQHGVGFPESVYQETVEEVGASSFEEFFEHYIHGTSPVPFDQFLAYAGLQIEYGYKNPDADTESEDIGDNENGEDQRTAPLPWLGVDTKEEQHRAVVTVSYTSGPARALLNPHDQIVAINGYQISSPSDLNKRLRSSHRSGESVEISLFRRGHLETVSVILGDAPYNQVTIRPMTDATAEQTAIRQDWLKSTDS